MADEPLRGQTGPSPSHTTPQQAPPPPTKADDDDDGPIRIDEDEDTPAAGGAASSIRAQKKRAFGSAASKVASLHKTDFRRPMNDTGHGVTRCRIFHCKIADTSLTHMETEINDWADSEQIDIKHVGHVVGTLEGKHADPNIVVLVWY